MYTAACIELGELKRAQNLLQYGETAYQQCLMHLLYNESLSLDDAAAMITIARQDITLVALLLHEASKEFTMQLVEIMIRWKGLYSELRSCLTQLGLGKNYRQTFVEISNLASTGDPNSEFYDVNQKHKRRERLFLRKYLIPTLNALSLQKITTIQSSMTNNQIILDYTIIPDHFDNANKLRGFVLLICAAGAPVVTELDSFFVDRVQKWRDCLVVNKAEDLSTHFLPLPGEQEAQALASIIFPPDVKSTILSSGVHCLMICPDALMGTLPLDLLPFSDGKILIDTHSLVILTSPREVIRKATIQYIKNAIAKVSDSDHSEDSAVSDFEHESAKDGSIPFLPSTMYSIKHLSQVEIIQPGESMIKCEIADSPSKAQCTNCYLVADPDYDLQSGDTNPPGCFQVFEQLGSFFFEKSSRRPVESLPMSREEAEKIEIILNSQPYTNLCISSVLQDKATLPFMLNLQSPHMLHLSTHGICIEDQHWHAYHGNVWSLNKVGLTLAGANTFFAGNIHKIHMDANIGVLTGLALCGMDLKQTNLVFLSTCVSATGNNPFQESVSSMASCARVAGSSTVIGTLWPIFDTTAVKFSSLFYTKLCSTPGVPPSEALAYAKQSMKQDGDHWYNWAAYVCFGCDLPFL